MSQEQFNRGVESLANTEVIKAALQRLSANGLNISDDLWDELEQIEDRAGDILIEAGPAEDTDFDRITAQEQTDLFKQVQNEREVANAEFARGFDEAHAATEIPW